jgi:hypothetical protein
MIVTNTSAATLAIVATTKIRINPIDNVTAIPISGSRINMTPTVTSAAIIIAPSINKNLTKGLFTSLPLIIIRVFISLLWMMKELGIKGNQGVRLLENL